jgi:two-component system OmpR family sensor kinase
MVTFTVAVAFAVVYRTTGAELTTQLDVSLRADAGQLGEAVTEQSDGRPGSVLLAAREYADSQGYSNGAVLFFAIVPGQGIASSHPELFGQFGPDDGENSSQQLLENHQGSALAVPVPGYSTQEGPDLGPLRIYERRVRLDSGLSFYAGAAESLEGIERAKHGVLKSFAVGGVLAFALALAFAWLTGARMSAPLRRASQVAALVDGGDLSPRLHLPANTSHELIVLAEAFNHMLDRLAAAFEGQREFVADASHELRTPLTVIRGQLELLAGSEEVEREEVLRTERVIQAEISRLTRLTDDLLLLARSDSDDFLRRRQVPLAAFISELWDGLSLTAARRFEVGTIADVTISADPDRLAQALRNLATNAISHTEAPDGLVAISAVLRSGDGPRRVLITVSDDGPGIPAELRQQVFERFYRADPSRARAKGGAGLGLAIVKAIVEAHGGSVRVREAPTGGAAFAVELPA